MSTYNEIEAINLSESEFPLSMVADSQLQRVGSNIQEKISVFWKQNINVLLSCDTS